MNDPDKIIIMQMTVMHYRIIISDNGDGDIYYNMTIIHVMEMTKCYF